MGIPEHITFSLRKLCSGQEATVRTEHGKVCAKSLQLCLTLCNPMDCGPLGSSLQGIL